MLNKIILLCNPIMQIFPTIMVVKRKNSTVIANDQNVSNCIASALQQENHAKTATVKAVQILKTTKICE
jgi:hypothetical protein